MDRKRAISAILTLVLFAGAAHAAEPPPLDANDAPAVNATINDLASSNFSTRDRAQRTLETIPYSQIDQLRKYAGGITDAEAKARLDAAIDHIEEVGVMTQPPISINVNGASASQVGEALAEVVGTRPPTVGDDALQSFTLHAKNQPFSEIVHLLSAQHPLFTPSGQSAITVQHVQSLRGAAIIVTPPARNGTAVTFQVGAIFDPRIKVLDARDPEISDVRDDQGQALDPDPNTAALLAAKLAIARRGIASQPGGFKAFNYSNNAPPGKRVTLRGSVTCVVAVSEAKTEIADAGKHVGEAIALGDSKVTLRDISPATDANARAGLQLQIVPNDSKIDAPPAPKVKFTATGMSINGGGLSVGAGTRVIIDNEGSAGGITIGGGGPSSGATHITVTDSTGKAIANYSVPRGTPVTSIHAVVGDFKEPLKFTFTYPTKTREVTIPFEFKNLPVK